VLPYSNQQLAWTYGGPLKKDRIHFFGTFEYEREPTTFSYSSPYPMFNFDQLSTRTEKKASLRLDFQFSPRTRLSLRGNKAINHLPIDNRFSGGATRHPSSGIETGRATNNILATVTQVLSSRVVNEVRGGDAAFSFYQHPVVKWPGHPVLRHFARWAGRRSSRSAAATRSARATRIRRSTPSRIPTRCAMT
jgi:hypothetical protein